MSIVVTGATGHLGRLVVTDLLARGVPADTVVAGVRDVAKAADLTAQGVQVRRLDYDDPAGVAAALAGARRVLLVSGTDFGRRVAQHTTVIRAAADAGVELLAYTSVANADSHPMLLGEEHRGTEAALRASGVPFTILRNGWYWENYTDQIGGYLAQGRIVGAAGQGLVSGATRADYAGAAAAVLAGGEHTGTVYELGGDTPATLADLAAEVSAQSGTEIGYVDAPVDEVRAGLLAAGLPEGLAAVLADVDSWIARGSLHVTSGDLARLAGRPTTSLAAAVAEALGRQG